jgi:hypothetical protein
MDIPMKSLFLWVLIGFNGDYQQKWGFHGDFNGISWELSMVNVD